ACLVLDIDQAVVLVDVGLGRRILRVQLAVIDPDVLAGAGDGNHVPTVHAGRGTDAHEGGAQVPDDDVVDVVDVQADAAEQGVAADADDRLVRRNVDSAAAASVGNRALYVDDVR